MRDRDWRKLPETRTARELAHEVKAHIDEIERRVNTLDEPTSRRGATNLEQLPILLEGARDLLFAEVEKLKELERTLEAMAKAKEKLLRERAT